MAGTTRTTATTLTNNSSHTVVYSSVHKRVSYGCLHFITAAIGLNKYYVYHDAILPTFVN